MAPSISRRISIAWGSGEPYEDTDTLVLVGERFFVDVRYKLSDLSLDWAMAGEKTWIHRPGEGEPPRARFVPFISSRTSFPPSQPNSELSLPDEGIFSDLPNGDQLEIGEMVDPTERLVKPYREIWREIPLSQHSASRSSTVGTINADSPSLKSKKVPVIFLRREDSRACVAQIGDWQLGIAYLSTQTYGAWKIKCPAEDEPAKTIWSIGGNETMQLAPPMHVLLPDHDPDEKRLPAPDSSVKYDGSSWVVLESYHYLASGC